MEDDLNIFENGRQPQFLETEDDLNFQEMADDINFFFENGIQPQIFLKIEDDSYVFKNELKYF